VGLPRVPGVTSSACEELAKPLTERIVSRLSWVFWVFFSMAVFSFFFFFSPLPLTLSWILARPGSKAVSEHHRSPVLGASASRSCVTVASPGQGRQNIICASDGHTSHQGNFQSDSH